MFLEAMRQKIADFYGPLTHLELLRDYSFKLVFIFDIEGVHRSE